jgi:hypothetical protein
MLLVVKRKKVFEKLYKKTVLGVYRAIHSIKSMKFSAGLVFSSMLNYKFTKT